jgi:hypothetical protein
MTKEPKIIYKVIDNTLLAIVLLDDNLNEVGTLNQWKEIVNLKLKDCININEVNIYKETEENGEIFITEVWKN